MEAKVKQVVVRVTGVRKKKKEIKTRLDKSQSIVEISLHFTSFLLVVDRLSIGYCDEVRMFEEDIEGVSERGCRGSLSKERSKRYFSLWI